MRADRRFRGSQLRQRGLPRVSRRAAPERYGCLERWRVLPYMQDIPLRIQGVLLEAVLSATLGEDDRVVVGRHDEDGFLRSCAAPWWRGTRFGQVTGGATARV
jgi:hypothetical protein